MGSIAALTALILDVSRLPVRRERTDFHRACAAQWQR